MNLAALASLKRYSLPVIIGILVFGSWQGWWVIPKEIYAALIALEMGFLRWVSAQVPLNQGPTLPASQVPADAQVLVKAPLPADATPYIMRPQDPAAPLNIPKNP
jgi:hypothetical protein